MKNYHIECITEETLLMNIVPGLTEDNIEHHRGSGRVCDKMIKGNDLIGIIDEDPDNKNVHPYFKKLYNNYESEKHSIRYSIDEKRNNRVIIIKPSFEPWIIDVAMKSNVKMADFNLSDNPETLHREVHFKKGDLQKLLHHLLKVKSPAIIRLKKIINS